MSTDQEKKILNSLLADTIQGSREISVILFIVNKYKEYSLIFIILLIIDLSGNMWLLLHMFRNFIALPTMHYSLITLTVLLASWC